MGPTSTGMRRTIFGILLQGVCESEIVERLTMRRLQLRGATENFDAVVELSLQQIGIAEIAQEPGVGWPLLKGRLCNAARQR